MSRLLKTLLASGLCLLVACGHQQQKKPTLTVSLPPQKYLLEAIVGDTYEVNSLLPSGSDPETYDPSVSLLAALQHSDAYFRLGGIGFEDAALQRIRENFPDLEIVDTSEGISFIRGTHGGGRGHHHAEAPDPHLWLSVGNAQVMARNMLREVSRLNPGKAKEYERRHAQLQAQLQQVDDSIRSMLRHSQGTTFLVWHPSLTYFARDYGLSQLAVETDGKEPSPRQVKERLDTARAHQPAVFFVEAGHDASQSQQFAAQLNLPATEVQLQEYDFLPTLLQIASKIQESTSKDAPAADISR